MRSLVAALLCIRLVDESTGFFAPAHLERFHRDFATSFGALGVMLAMPYFGAIAGTILITRSDGTDRKRVTVFGAAVIAAAMFVFAAATGITMLCAAAWLSGAGSTCLIDAGEIALSNAADTTLEQTLERTLARANLGAVVGDLLAPLLVGASRVAGIEWRWIFVGAGALVAWYAVTLAGLTFAPPRQPEPHESDGPDTAPPRPILRHAAVWWLGVAALITGPLDEPYLATVLAFVQDRRGVSPVAATVVACGFVAGGLLVFTVFLRHVEGRGAPGVLLTAGATMAATALLVVVAPAWAIVVVGLFHSAALDTQWLTLQTAALRVAPGREGRAMALIQAIEMAGIAIPIAFGVVADHFGIEWGMVCFAVLPLLLVAPAIGLHRARLSGATP